MHTELTEFQEAKPLRNLICIFPITESQMTKSGLIIPYAQNGKGDAHHGRVVAVGPGYYKANGVYHAMDYKVGDIVLYGRGAGHEINLKGVIHKIITDDDVTGIFTGDEASL